MYFNQLLQQSSQSSETEQKSIEQQFLGIVITK